MPGGRPRKFLTAVEAKKEDNRRQYLRRRQPQQWPEFIAYEPQIPGDQPIQTPTSLGLRISADIPIAPGALDSPTEPITHEPSIPTAIDIPFPINHTDAEISAQIERIRASEGEWNNEQAEYEAAIAHQMEERVAQTAKGMMEIQLGGVDTNTAADTAATGESEAVTLPDEVDLPADLASTDDSAAGDSATFAAPEATTEVLCDVPALSQRRFTSSSHSSGRSSRNQSTFPAQTNNLLSWLQPAATRSPASHVLPQPANQRPPNTGLSGHPTRSSANRTPPNGTPPCRTVSREGGLIPELRNSTAVKLAKQLRNFQGCTHEQHQEADQQHQAHHQRPDVHSACSNLQQITQLLRGDYEGGTRLPDVIGNPKLMKPADLPAGLDCRSAFEGTSPQASPQDAGTPDENLPRNLCLSQHHHSSAKYRAANTTFDVDSLCCFPSSLGIARQGINWFPRSHAFLNFSQDIHFSLNVPAYNNRGDLKERRLPLHRIPHYCIGTAIGMDSLSLYVFFPELHIDSSYEHSTYLSTKDQQLWYDAVLFPALIKTLGDSNLAQHYPVSAHVASLDATALAAESFARKEVAREQLLKYALQPQHLDALWTRIQESISANPGFARFRCPTLFMHAKNTKLEYMDASASAAYIRWEQRWSAVADLHFYNRDRTYVDFAKQVTSEDSALPYDYIPHYQEAETFLWRRCCLEAYARTRIVTLADGRRGRGSPRCTTYPWATMRDTMGQTLFANPQGQESLDGLVYSQFYALIKTPFDTSKAYVFDNESLENLALDPGYIRSLQQQGGGITFSQAVCTFAYLHSKKRAHANLTDNQWRSYGIREEHRISLSMMDEIEALWRQWDLYDDSVDDVDSPLPYYILPTQTLLKFLSAQINKYCFLFEHTLAHAARTYSLPETMVMVVALRALRFCYGSSLLPAELLLYKNRWEQRRGADVVVKEGMGMQETMERCGLGWFLPKFHWATRRLAPPHGDNMLVGNLLMHAEYKRRWQAVKDLRDVFVRFNQAESWYDRYSVQRSPRRLRKWLEYLHVLNIAQFDADVWTTMLAVHKRSPELSPQALEQKGDVAYCYHGMKGMFSTDGVICPPHVVTGNKMRFERVAELLDYLFLWDDGAERSGWGCKPYRLILQKTFELIERRLSYRKASRWLDEFLHLVRLTHWILPYPSTTSLITSTKTSRRQGLARRMMWFSAVYAHPEQVELPFTSMPSTLHRLFWKAHRRTHGDQPFPQPWSTRELIQAGRKQGIRVYGIEEDVDHWISGRRSTGSKGFLPVWERSRTPTLRMLVDIRDKSLDELEELMARYTQDETQLEEPRVDDSASGVSADRRRSAPLRRSVREFFQPAVENAAGSRSSAADEGLRSCTAGSTGSEFVPSLPSS
jgi:hypothetical protein